MFGSSPPLRLSSGSSTGDNFLTLEGGSWWEEEPNHIRQEAWSSVNDCILAALDRDGKFVNFENCRRIMHGDLAARNILVGENYTAKISDFGLSKMMYYNQGM
jgi:serine/threonine protein kinase